jgi:hypothetical protein
MKITILIIVFVFCIPLIESKGQEETNKLFLGPYSDYNLNFNQVSIIMLLLNHNHYGSFEDLWSRNFSIGGTLLYNISKDLSLETRLECQPYEVEFKNNIQFISLSNVNNGNVILTTVNQSYKPKFLELNFGTSINLRLFYNLFSIIGLEVGYLARSTANYNENIKVQDSTGHIASNEYHQINNINIFSINKIQINALIGFGYSIPISRNMKFVPEIKADVHFKPVLKNDFDWYWNIFSLYFGASLLLGIN